MAVLWEVWVFLEMGNSLNSEGEMQTLGSVGAAESLPISFVDVLDGGGAGAEGSEAGEIGQSKLLEIVYYVERRYTYD